MTMLCHARPSHIASFHCRSMAVSYRAFRCSAFICDHLIPRCMYLYIPHSPYTENSYDVSLIKDPLSYVHII